MSGTIIAGVDGSSESVQAAALAATIARASGADCRLFHAVSDYWSAVAVPMSRSIGKSSRKPPASTPGPSSRRHWSDMFLIR